MAPPQELAGRYKEYKLKTKNIVFWMTKEAARCCDLHTIVQSLTAKKNDTRRTPNTHQTAGQHNITTNALLRLAKVIDSAQPPPDVPKGLVLIIEDVIADRECCNSWDSAQALSGDSKVASENDSHRHFIDVLRDVLDILRSAQTLHESSAKAESKKKEKPTSGEVKPQERRKAVNNFYATLESEEPVANPLGSAPSVDTTAMDQPSSPPELRLEEVDDNGFRCWCFLEDLANIRMFVKSAWKDYMLGELSLLAAEVTMETAFGLLRRTDELFAKTSPFGSTDWLELLEYLGITYFVRHSSIWMHPSSGTASKPRMASSEVNVVELLCPIAFACLQSWKADAASFCEVNERYRKTGDRYQEFARSGSHKYHEICSLLFHNVQQFYFSAHGRTSKASAHDEFTQALVDVHIKGQFPMWAVVLLQIYMDMLDSLGSHGVHGVVSIREQFAHIKKLHADVKAFRPTSKCNLQDNGF